MILAGMEGGAHDGLSLRFLANPEAPEMKTLFLLMAQYEGRAVIPLETVCRDYFTHLKPDHLVRKVSLGELRLPLLRLDDSAKSARGVHIEDLAEYLERRAAMARNDMRQMHGG